MARKGGRFFAIDLQPAINLSQNRRVAESQPQSSQAPAGTSTDVVGKVVWRFQNPEHGASFRSSAAVAPDAVIVGSRDKQLRAFDPKTGAPLWSFHAKGRIDSSPVIVGKRVFVGSADGRVYAIDMATGKEVWNFEAGGAVTASPAVAEKRLVIGTDSGALYCFGAKPVKTDEQQADRDTH